jgi:hypothetical protein
LSSSLKRGVNDDEKGRCNGAIFHLSPPCGG